VGGLESPSGARRAPEVESERYGRCRESLDVCPEFLGVSAVAGALVTSLRGLIEDVGEGYREDVAGGGWAQNPGGLGAYTDQDRDDKPLFPVRGLFGHPVSTDIRRRSCLSSKMHSGNALSV